MISYGSLDRMKKGSRLISSMIRVGLIGFGGGNALIPVLEQIAVD